MKRNFSTILILLLSFFSYFVEGKETDGKEQSTCCQQPPVCPPKCSCPKRPPLQLSGAYNASARANLDNCSEIGLYFKPTFIYWQARQDQMELGAALESEATDFFDVAFGVETTATIKDHSFAYKPGFQLLVGAHLDPDEWDISAEYTWFFSQTKSSLNIGNDTLTTDVGITPTRGNPYLLHEISLIESFPSGGSAAVFNRAEQKWHLKLQSLDTAISRTYFAGKKLVIESSWGARFAWMTQKNLLTYASDGVLIQSAGLVGTYQMKQSFALWGAGVLGKIKGDWALGKGCSLISRASADLLYARVQASNAKFSWIEGKASPAVFRFPEKRPDFLLPHTLLEFGFAWKTPLDCYRWNLELEATYSFQVFWNANLFRNFTDYVATISQRPSGNLYIQGLNVAARSDF